MSNQLTRLLLALILLLASPLIYLVIFMILGENLVRNDAAAFLMFDLFAGLFVAVGWIWIWRRDVVWTTRRRQMTGFAVVWAIGPAVLVGALILAVDRSLDEAAAILGGLCWLVVWLASTVLIWRETSLERMRRLGETAEEPIVCPTCGYDMRGLQQARCPECGTQYTLDELLVVVRGQVGDLESEQTVVK